MAFKRLVSRLTNGKNLVNGRSFNCNTNKNDNHQLILSAFDHCVGRELYFPSHLPLLLQILLHSTSNAFPYRLRKLFC